MTLTHVLFNHDRHGLEKTQALARAELRELNEAQVRFEQASGPWTYVGQEPEEVASHFGAEMQAQLFSNTMRSFGADGQTAGSM